ncbi:MAG: protein-glutamate O-methyltransferase CheR [Holophagales bacterium]|jgi:chemotaxis protein methyltransferase CheR|nr:protein-glutamate O-methyltransferase CheR [Holophagales bacterium]
MSAQDFLALRDFVYSKSGIYFREAKKYFLENRIGKRINELTLPSYREYFNLLQGPKGLQELKFLFNEVTTNETSFWRNPPQIEAFQNFVLPEAVAVARKRGANKFRIWSAACSSGEEPYTLAMICREKDSLLRGLSVEIMATDISERVMKLAMIGQYGSYTLRNLNPGQLKLHFDQKGDDIFEVKPELKELVVYKNFNLVDYQGYRSLGMFDVIFCRNVLIYFDDVVKTKVIAGFHEQLNPKTYLMVGHSESISNYTSGFELVHFSMATGYRKNT